MNDDYLWNKTGEPDEEVKELEEILGVLRYQPRELVLPKDLSVPRRRNYYPLLAIAATVAFALLAAGLWFSFKSSNNSSLETAKTKSTPESSPLTSPKTNDDSKGQTNAPQVAGNNKAPQPTPRRKQVRHSAANPALAAKRQREREEALAAKEQLLIALRLASEKLNQAQRRTQIPAIPNQIRNQHKVG
jgi:hypothetical protein